MSGRNIVAALAIAVIAAGIFVASTCTFIVDERQQVVVTRLSRPVHVIVGGCSDEEFARLKQEIMSADYGTEGGDANTNAAALRVDRGAGLYFKMPLVDAVETFPDVMMVYDAEPEDVVTADKKKVIVDNFARWRIENPLMFRIRVRTASAAHGMLDDIIYSIVREELGRNNLIEVIRSTNQYVEKAPQPNVDAEASPETALVNPMRETIQVGREKIMNSVARRADEAARRRYGIRVIDVRIKRAELLPENLQGVFGRMQAERSAISKAYRSEGQKQADIIEGNTNRQMQVITANAERDAMKLKGEGDGEAIRIYAEAFNSNPKLYEFMRSLEVISENTPAGSELVIGIDSGLFSLLKHDAGKTN